MDIKKLFSLKNMGTAGKIGLAIVVPSVALAGYYVIDRKFIKNAPLFPFNLQKARENQANDAMMMAEKKLKVLLHEGKINGFGVVGDPETKIFYIEVASDNITAELKGSIPSKVGNVQVRLVQREKAKTQ